MTLSRRTYFIIIALAMAAASLTILLSPDIARTQSQDRQKKEEKPKDQKPSDAVVRLATELVQIDVVVTDKAGKLVSDLKRDDFELLEDGKRQTVSYFSVGTASRTAVAPGAINREKAPEKPDKEAPPELSAGRNMVLAIDDLHLAPGNLVQAKQALLKFIEQQISSEDRVAIVTTSGALGLYQKFTSDRDALRRGINRLSVRERQVTNNMDIPRITPYQAELIDLGDNEALELAVQELIRQYRMERPMAVSEAQNRARGIIAENTHITMNTLSTIENIIRGLKDLPGRKVIALLSDGFLLGGFREGRQYDVRRITDAATRAGVVIYSIDARGLVAVPTTMDASVSGSDPPQLMGARSRIEFSSIEAQRDGLNALARDTGGIPIFNNNDLNLGLKRILDDTETYYLLAFEPTTSYRDGRFRKLEVKVPRRPELKVRTRKGYFAPDDKAAEKEAREKAKQAEKDQEKSPEKLAKEAQEVKNQQVRQGVSSLFPLRGIPLEMVANYLNSPEDGSIVDLAAHLDARMVAFDEVNGRHRAMVEVVTMVFDEKGKLADGLSDKIEMNLKPASLENTRRNGLSYNKKLKLKPGYYQLQLVVRQDGHPQIGSASTWIEIPDLARKQLTLSSIFLAMDDDGAKPAEAPDKPAPIDRKNDSPVLKNIFRRFTSDSKFDFLILTYNARQDAQGATDVVVQSQIRSGDKLLFASPLTAFGNQQVKKDGDFLRIPYMARLSLASFTPGKYELKVVVVDRNAKTSAKAAVNFTIE